MGLQLIVHIENGQPLACLETAARDWKPEIDGYMKESLRNPTSPSIQSCIEGICINNKPICDRFGNVSELAATLKLAMAIVENGKELVSDVVGIMCSVATMCGELREHFQGDDAEEKWHKLLESVDKICKQAKAAYERHQYIYDQIFEMLSRLLPPRLVFCLRVAATIICAVWPYRHQIVSWIAANWEVCITGLAVGGAILGIGAAILGGVLLYKHISDDRRNSSRDPSRRN